MFAASKSGKAVSSAPKDAQFNYVTMLLHGDGTNGAQNNTFLDSSSNTFTITRNGNTTQGSFSPYGSNWSNYFGGSDYFTLPDSSAWSQAGDYTIECWYNPQDFSGAGANRNLIGYSSAASTIWLVQVDTTGHPFFRWYNTSVTAYSITSSTVMTLGTWNHIAVTFSGTTVTLWLNGVSVGTTTISGSVRTASSCGLGIGSWGLSTSDPHPVGYMSNARIVKGTAVYTSAFTPPTSPLTAISGTQLLACQSNRFIDNSSNAFALTSSGTPSVQRFNPFGTSTAYSTATIGGSGYFDGSGDYLTITGNSGFNFGTNDFTVEAWIYQTGFSGYWGMIDTRPSASLANWAFGLFSGPKLDFLYVSGRVTSSATVPSGAWTHVAVTRSSGTIRLFINGVLDANTASYSSAINAGLTNPLIGAVQDPYYATGYISNMRINTTTALYTSSFILSTSPFTAVSGTSLLLNMTNGAIYDNAMMNDLETVGNAQISTSVVKYGTGSIYIPADTSSARCKPNDNKFAFGTGSWTVEAWIYVSSATPNGWLLMASQDPYTSDSASFGWGIGYNIGSSNSKFTLNINSSGTFYGPTSTNTFSTSTWYHVAATYDGSTLRLFVNGNLEGSTSGSYNIAATNLNLFLGWAQIGGVKISAYFDEVRITKGYCRYTTTFTPPTAAFPNTGPV
jgi:hypothetical protein